MGDGGVMGIEQSVEAGLKTALQAGVTTSCAYRTFLSDDAPTQDEEVQDYPKISIKAAPMIPDGYGSLHKSTSVVLRVVTHKDTDKKRATLLALYDEVRAVVDADNYAISGASKVSTQIVGSDSGVDENEQYMELELVVSTCGG